MKIKIQNDFPNIRVSVNQTDKNSIVISLTPAETEPAPAKTEPTPTKKATRALSSAKPGETVTIGEREYIVLDHSKETTAIIAKKPTKTMPFGKNGDYVQSDVRTYCNDEFYKELCEAVGRDNIISHKVNLMADDGSNKGTAVIDNVSILTNDLYRRYRDYLPVIGSCCWTATRPTARNIHYDRLVCVIDFGILRWDGCKSNVTNTNSHGVRPYCILKSSVEVS